MLRLKQCISRWLDFETKLFPFKKIFSPLPNKLDGCSAEDVHGMVPTEVRLIILKMFGTLSLSVYPEPELVYASATHSIASWMYWLNKKLRISVFVTISYLLLVLEVLLIMLWNAASIISWTVKLSFFLCISGNKQVADESNDNQKFHAQAPHLLGHAVV